MATSVKLDDDLKGRIQHLAGARQRSSHWIIREAIREYVEREEARMSFAQEADASWQHFQETGLHLDADEVKNWLKTWGTADETDAPDCHK